MMHLSPSKIRCGLLMILTLQSTVTILALRYSREHNANGQLDSRYLASCLVMTTESLKLFFVMSALIVYHTRGSVRKTIDLLRNQVWCRPRDTLLLALPSFLYVLQDNLVIHAISHLDAATFQVTYQIRILTTAFFAKVMLKKQLTSGQWFALFMLVTGVGLAQLEAESTAMTNSKASGADASRYISRSSNYATGLLALGCATLTSGFSGVFIEKLVKDGRQPSLLIRNIQLSCFSIWIALAGVIWKDGYLVSDLGFFHGFRPITWFIVFLQALGGIIIAASMKYADNILKTFASAMSIIFSCILSYLVLGDGRFSSPSFMLGAFTIIAATILYNLNAPKAKMTSLLDTLNADTDISSNSIRVHPALDNRISHFGRVKTHCVKLY